MARRKKFRPPKISTVVGRQSTIQGDIVFSGGLHVDGKIVGDVTAEQDNVSTLTLSEQGTVEGEINVPNVILNGTVVGNVHASQRVELAPKAKITGTVYYDMLEMAMGAEVNGQLIHSPEGQKKLGYLADPEKAREGDADSSGKDPVAATESQQTAEVVKDDDEAVTDVTRERRGRKL